MLKICVCHSLTNLHPLGTWEGENKRKVLLGLPRPTHFVAKCTQRQSASIRDCAITRKFLPVFCHSVKVKPRMRLQRDSTSFTTYGIGGLRSLSIIRGRRVMCRKHYRMHNGETQPDKIIKISIVSRTATCNL